MGYALHLAQIGDKHPNAHRMHGNLRDVHEVREAYESDAYRVMYTVSFPEAVYVLHAFEKKSTRGISTPKHELALIERRLREARRHYEKQYQEERKK